MDGLKRTIEIVTSKRDAEERRLERAISLGWPSIEVERARVDTCDYILTRLAQEQDKIVPLDPSPAPQEQGVEPPDAKTYEDGLREAAEIARVQKNQSAKDRQEGDDSDYDQGAYEASFTIERLIRALLQAEAQGEKK